MTVALDTSITYTLNRNSSLDTGYRIKQVNFGDGYTQTLLDGINYEQEIWNLEFNPLSYSDTITLEGILKNSVNGSSNIIAWTPPFEGTTKYWKATNIKRRTTGILFITTCTLTRDYTVI